jgi:outer membrane PBP1 activator LpoA protein
MLQRRLRSIVMPILVGVLLAGCSNSGGSQAPATPGTDPAQMGQWQRYLQSRAGRRHLALG